MASLLEAKPILFPGEADLRDNLLSYVKKYSDARSNTGEKLTPQEQAALSFLEQYQIGGDSEYGKAAGDEILKTLRGEYNPETSAYYAPVIKGIEQRRDQARDTLRRSFNLGGNLSSLSRARAEADNNTSYEAQIAQIMLGLQQDERNRMLGIIPQALQYGQYVEEGPLRKARASTEFDIPRQLETGAINTGTGILTGYKPSYYFEPTDDYLNKILGSTSKSKGLGAAGIGSLIGAGIGTIVAPGAGTLTGAQLGGQLGGYFG